MCDVITVEWLGSWDETAPLPTAPAAMHACSCGSVGPGIVMLKSSLRQWPLSWDGAHSNQPHPPTHPYRLQPVPVRPSPPPGPPLTPAPDPA